VTTRSPTPISTTSRASGLSQQHRGLNIASQPAAGSRGSILNSYPGCEVSLGVALRRQFVESDSKMNDSVGRGDGARLGQASGPLRQVIETRLNFSMRGAQCAAATVFQFRPVTFGFQSLSGKPIPGLRLISGWLSAFGWRAMAGWSPYGQFRLLRWCPEAAGFDVPGPPGAGRWRGPAGTGTLLASVFGIQSAASSDPLSAAGVPGWPAGSSGCASPA
jgi:hypothetical protein